MVTIDAGDFFSSGVPAGVRPGVMDTFDDDTGSFFSLSLADGVASDDETGSFFSPPLAEGAVALSATFLEKGNQHEFQAKGKTVCYRVIDCVLTITHCQKRTSTIKVSSTSSHSGYG